MQCWTHFSRGSRLGYWTSIPTSLSVALNRALQPFARLATCWACMNLYFPLALAAASASLNARTCRSFLLLSTHLARLLFLKPPIQSSSSASSCASESESAPKSMRDPRPSGGVAALRGATAFRALRLRDTATDVDVVLVEARDAV